MIRTRCTKRSNWAVISNCSALSVLKTSLFGLIVLLVMSVSVSSAFVESAYAEEEPIKTVLDITHLNILDSIEGCVDCDIAKDLLQMGEIEFDKAIAALEEDPPNIVDAKKSAIIAMALFEDSAVAIGALENQASTLLPPGFGAAIDSASDEGITKGQGLGVGGIPPGILKQIQAANMFGVHEEIVSIENEADELRELIKLNNLEGIGFDDLDESVNLSKTLLAKGVVPDAQVQLILANKIIEELYVQIEAAADDKSISSIEEMLGDQKNLGLAKKEIRELEEMLEDLSTDDINTSENSGEGETSGDAAGQNKGEGDAPGNSGDAPGQNKGNDEAELPPGFGAAGENPSNTAIENENAVGLGLGKEGESGIPPGLAKLFGYEDGTGANANFEAPEDFAPLPPGFGAAIGSVSDEGLANGKGLGLGNIPRGIYIAFNDKPDDFFENHYEASIDGTFEGTYDGTNRGHSSGKGSYGASPLKSGIAPGSLIADIKSGGAKPFCAGKALGGVPIILLDDPTEIRLDNGEAYEEPGFRACDVGKFEITDDVVVVNPVLVNVNGTYIITYNVASMKTPFSANEETRIVGVGEFDPFFEVLVVRPAPEFEAAFTGNFDTDLTKGPPQYHVGTIQNIFVLESIASVVIDTGVLVDGDPAPSGTNFVTYTVTDNLGNVTVITETVTR